MMKKKILPLIALGLSLASMVVVAQEAKHEFSGQVALISASKKVVKSVAAGTTVPYYTIEVDNNSGSTIYATAYDGYGGQKTFTVDPYYAAMIHNDYNPPMGYEISITSNRSGLIFDGFVRSLACIDVHERGVYVDDYCL